MIFKFSETSFTGNNKDYTINGESYNDFPIISIGKYSYIVDATVETTLREDSNSLIVGNYCSLAHNLSFLINLNHDYKYVSTYPLDKVSREFDDFLRDSEIGIGQIIIKNDVWIGRNATILDGVVIGNGAIVAANAVVTKDVPDYAIVAGNPAKIVKYRFEEDTIRKLKTIKWWYWDENKMLQNKKFFTTYEHENIDEIYNDSLKSLQIEKSIKPEWVCFEEKILFLPDFNSKYSIWKKVINQFQENFNGKSAALVLYVDDISKYDVEIQQISDMLSVTDKPIEIFIEDKNLFKESYELLNYVTSFVTNRDIKSVKVLDYCDMFNTKVYNGMNRDIFY